MLRTMPCFNSYLPLVWNDSARPCCSRTALDDIMQSARGIGGAEGSCIVLLREDAELEVMCAHGIAQDEFLEAFGAGAPGVRKHETSLISIPFVQGLRQRGALCLFRLRAPQMSELDMELLECLAAQAELALAVASQHSAIARLQADLNQPSAAVDDEPLLIEDAALQPAPGAQRAPTSA